MLGFSTRSIGLLGLKLSFGGFAYISFCFFSLILALQRLLEGHFKNLNVKEAANLAELNLEQIKKIIPHREPFLLIDKVLELEPGKRVVAVKKLSENEPWFKGHFPSYAVQPGVLTIEMLAQAGAVCVLSMEQHAGKIALFAGIDKARFKRQILPGDEITLVVENEGFKGPVGFARCEALVKEQVAVVARLMFSLVAKK